MTNVTRGRLWVSIVVLVVASLRADDKPASKPKEVRVLFLGNSQTYYQELPRIVEALADSAPKDRPRIKAEQALAGGASLQSLWNMGTDKGKPRARIEEGKWDFVILQDIYFTKPDSFEKYATLFHELIAKHGGKTVLFCTAGIPKQYPDGFREMLDMHVAVGKKLKVPVAAAGKSWLECWGESPTEEQRLALYHADKAHPGFRGSYIYACSLYAVLTGQSPVGLTNRMPRQPAEAIAPQEAKKFQEAAWKVHQEINGK